MDPATKEAEAFLRSELEYNIAHKILPSENRIIERLLSARTSMREVYAELYRNLPAARQRQTVLGALVTTAAFFAPDKTKVVRDQMACAVRLNREIADKARELAVLIRCRRDACPDIRLPTDCHPADLIERAAQCSTDDHKAYLFRWHLLPHLTRLRGQYDLKYWPETDELLDALACVQDDELPAASDAVMSEAIDSRSHSDADFTRALLAVIDESKIGSFGPPPDFSLTAGALACFSNCALGRSEPNEETLRKRRYRARKKERDSSPEKM